MVEISQTDYDVIIIGAGHNGLVAAATLAKKGYRVGVFEQSDTIGGMSRSSKLGGHEVPQISHLVYNLNPVVLKELGLSGKIDLKPINTISLCPDGNHVEVSSAAATFLDGTDYPDQEAYKTLRNKINKFAELLSALAHRSPPNLTDGLNFRNLGDASALVNIGLKAKMMGTKELREFLRIILSNIFDLVNEEMQDGLLAGQIAADAIFGAWAGPRSPGTVFSLLYRNGNDGEYFLPVDGIGSICDAFAQVAKNHGTQIHVRALVQKLIVEKDKTTGIILQDGKEISAKAVLSSVGALPSMQIAGIENFDTEAVRRIRNIRAKGMTAKINFVLKTLPGFTGLSAGKLPARLIIAPTMSYIERAFNSAKYGELPNAPVMEILLPTLESTDPPSDGEQVVSVIVQYIPYHLKSGWTEDSRQQLTDLVIDTLSTYAPDFRRHIIASDTLAPADIERLTGAPGGHWHHAEMSTDQILTVRPVNGMSRYAFAVESFYLCGAGTHPGGDISGLAGRNGALQLLKDGVLFQS